MTTEQRKKNILDEIDKLFGDTSVSQAQTKDALEEIACQLDGLINCLDDEGGDE